MQYLLFLTPSLKELVRISYAYRTPILLLSVLVAFAFAALLLSSTEGRQLAGSWVKYVGWAFLAYGFQYIFRLLGWLLRDSQGQLFLLLKILCNFLANLGSGANNLFFLAAALVLLNWRTPFLQPRIFIPIVTTTAAFTTAANFYFVELASPWAASFARLPDALFSALCLGLFGYATTRNFLTHKRHAWATVSIIIALVYGAIQIMYSANPVWAKRQESEIQNVLRRANYSPKPTDPVEFLDSALFAIALPMKMLLFLPPFYLFFTLIIAAHDFRKVLRVVTEQKKSYLSSDGIVQAIGTSISATLVEVIIKLPGTAPKGAWRIRWPRDQSDSFIPLEPEDKVDPRLLKVLSGRPEIPLEHSGERTRKIDTSMPPNSEVPSAMLPVRFHGAVIGCLKADFRRPRSFNYAALQQLNSMADLLGPAVQDYRALASIDQLSDRFARLQVQKPGAEFNETTVEMGTILYDVLSPLAVGLLLESGFRSNHIIEGEEAFRRLLEGQTVRYEVEDLTTEVIRTDIREVIVYKNQLVATHRDDPLHILPLGNLVLILPSEHDEIDRPTLGDYSLHRRTIASQTADGFLDLVREHLSYELKILSIALNAEALTQDAWLANIEEMCSKVGLPWVGVTQTGSVRIWGDPIAQEILSQLSEEQRSTLEETPISCVPYHDQSTQTHHVLRIDLAKSRHQLWFGIAREGFGLELDFPSPWRAFLEDFQKIVDSALASLFEVQRSKETLAKSAEDLGVVNIAITTGHLMHELANKVDAQQLPAESLWKAVERGSISLDANQRAQMKAILNGATVMKDLMSIFKDVTKTDERGTFPLRDVVKRATEFYQQIIIQDRVELRNRVKDNVWINIPFNIALFSIANLVGNSKEAIEEHMKEAAPEYVGKIKVEAKSEDDYVYCYVIDNGPGIPKNVREKLYQLGSTKRGHNGWGLYLTNRSLREHGGEIELLESCPGLTKFSLKFPKAKSP
jgi:signal transduction histidine kinase